MNTQLRAWCIGVLEAVCLAAVAAVPLFVNFYGFRVFDLGKAAIVTALALVGALAGLVAIVEGGVSGWRRAGRHPLVVAAALLWVAWALAAATSACRASACSARVSAARAWSSSPRSWCSSARRPWRAARPSVARGWWPCSWRAACRWPCSPWRPGTRRGGAAGPGRERAARVRHVGQPDLPRGLPHVGRSAGVGSPDRGGP